MNNPPSHDSVDRTAPRRIGSFAITEQVAQSYVGTVYRGVDESGGSQVLVKVARPGIGELRVDEDTLEVLDHPAIVAVLCTVRSSEGNDALVQVLPRGRPIEEELSSFDGQYRRIAQFIREAARILEYAHAYEVTHGDISERTLLVGDEDGPVFSEFGMGPADRQVPSGSRTAANSAESRERKFKIDERADLFGLGAVLYRLLSGRRATDTPIALASDPSTPHDDVAPIDRAAPEAPTELRAICAQALSTDPIHRYLHATTLVRDLDVYLQGKRSRPGVKVAFILLAALTVGLFGLWGTIGGGPARIIDVQMRVRRSAAGAAATETLESGQRAMAPGDRCQVHVRLSKAGYVSVFYRTPSGQLVKLGSSLNGAPAEATFELPDEDAAPEQWWQLPGSGGVGLMLIVSHGRSPPTEGLVEGVLLGLGEPPRSFTSLSLRGQFIEDSMQPELAPPAAGATARRTWRSFGEYADQAIKALTADNDDVVVGLLYVIGV